MIELSGYRRSGEIDIVFTGVRPGEKLFGELQYGGESIDKTRHPRIYIGKIAGVPWDELAAALDRLRVLASTGSCDDIRAFLVSFLPEAQLNGSATVHPAAPPKPPAGRAMTWPVSGRREPAPRPTEPNAAWLTAERTEPTIRESE